jgi:hypothetical protein
VEKRPRFKAGPKTIPASTESSQAWFWTKEWQAGEREASEDIEARRTTLHTSDRGFLSSLGAHDVFKAH